MLLGSSDEPRELAERGRALLLQYEHKQLRGPLDGLGTARARTLGALALTQHVGLMFPIVESSAVL